jgi:uncharacterized protein YbjT (DUF2867 family)
MGQADGFEERDRVGAANTAAAAAQAGVARIVHLGGFGADEAGGYSSHLAVRYEVGAVLASGPVPVIELRAGVIIGSGSV